VRTIDNLTLIADPRAWLGMLTWPKFSVTSYLMLSSLARQDIAPATVIDVGANVGQFAVAALKLLPLQIMHCFEPLPDCAEKLAHHVSGYPGVTVHGIGLSSAPGEAQLHVNSHRHSSSFLPLAAGHRNAFPEAVDQRTITVPISTLDIVFAGVELRPPVLLKLDVQGYEGNIIRGGEKTLSRVDYVILETSFRQMYEGELLFIELLRLMESYGFGFLRPIGFLSHPKTGEFLQMDALFQRAR
jgi:FkbM family methyltransferase